jgi:hypothetical protein
VGNPGQATVSQGCVILRATELHRQARDAKQRRIDTVSLAAPVDASGGAATHVADFASSTPR